VLKPDIAPPKQFNAQNLVVRAAPQPDGLITRVTPELAGWDHIYFEARTLAPGGSYRQDTGEHELALVLLGGTVSVQSSRGTWPHIGKRSDVFAGKPEALYLPRHTQFTVIAQSACEFALAWCATDRDHAPRLVTQADVPVEIRGGDNATRQINGIVPPGFDCHCLVLVEVYTPGGSWSSYPPHKHDVHREDAAGDVLEADLEEVYFYKLRRPEGYAYQRVYTDAHSPLQQAGYPIDAVIMARNNDAVLVPEGYHPVVAPPGYDCYYLNVLAGSAQSLANQDDPAYAWVKHSYTHLDPRVPLYPIE
jgi:5-deoxy-glucuronate isomerase